MTQEKERQKRFIISELYSHNFAIKMEDDDNGLELSLGLSCGHTSANSKDKNDNSLDTRIGEGDRSRKLIDDFKNFLEGGTLKQESGNGSQRSDPANPDGGFCNNFFNAPVDLDASKNSNVRGPWVANNTSAAEVDVENGPEASKKRKNLFEEINNQKKHERESHNGHLHEKAMPSHISITTDDGSTAENEDVADSEVEGSTSRLVSHHDGGVRKYVQGASPSEVSREVHTVIDSSMGDLQGQNRFAISSEKEFKVGNMHYGVPITTQSVNMLNVPYSLPVKESKSVGVSSTSGYPLPGTARVLAAANSEHAGTQPLMRGNLPVMYGYSPVQIPSLDKDNSRSLVSHPHQLHQSYAGRVLPNSDKHNDGLKISQAAMPVIIHKPSEASQNNGRALEQANGDGKQHATNGGCSSQTEDGMKRSNMTFGAKEESDEPIADGLTSEFPTIRPGIAAELKFGGCGSYPNLPWVSTKGPGPNGRTISGVTYRYSATQIKIVCACHGSHMSPEEFVQHAGEENLTNLDSLALV